MYTQRLHLAALILSFTLSLSKSSDNDGPKTTKNQLMFQVVPETIKMTDNVLKAVLKSSENEEFVFNLEGLKGDVLRIQVIDPAKKRFSASDALVENPIKGNITLVRSTKDLITLQSGTDLIEIRYKPFLLQVTRDKYPIIEINKGNRMFISQRSSRLVLDFAFPAALRAYGIPEHAERLSLRPTGKDKPYRLYNLDTYGYETESKKPLYGSIPVLYAVGTPTTGIFWLNAADTLVHIENTKGTKTVFDSESGAMDFFLFTGPTLRHCVKQYTSLTGITPLPPYFALGYHQSRYSYDNQSDVEKVVTEFDEHVIPVDTIWLDIDHTDGYRYFTWNYTAFPDPLAMQETLYNHNGRRLVAISDPHIKVDHNYSIYNEGVKKGYFVTNPDGTDFQGECWPGKSTYIDFFNKEAADWYSSLFLPENWKDTGSTVFVWNDMNEPSVFGTEDKTMPKTLVHHQGWLHKDVHNMYGFKQTEATFNGLKMRDANHRPFVLTRAHFAGSQRFAAMWTGDNNPTWDHLRISIPMLLTESLAGMAFCGTDVGGFTGNVSDDLLARWYQLGIWYPFFRGHSGKGTERREPYLSHPAIVDTIRDSIVARYAHLPHWYTLWFGHQFSGRPLMRSLSYQYPEDLNTLDIDDQFLIGSGILICPVLEQNATVRKCYIPDSEWIDRDNKVAVYKGTVTFNVTEDSIPTFYKTGRIVVTQDGVIPSTERSRTYPYTLNVFCGTRKSAVGYLYMDDYESFDYLDGIFAYYRIKYSCRSDTLSINELHQSAFVSKLRFQRIVVWKSSKVEMSQFGYKAQKRTYNLIFKSNDAVNVTINLLPYRIV